MIVRPALIGGARLRSASMYCHLNSTRDTLSGDVLRSAIMFNGTGNDGAITVQPVHSRQDGNLLEQYAWLKFLTPLTNPVLSLLYYGSPGVTIGWAVDEIPSAAAVTGRMIIYGMTQNWDPATLTWDNQPSLLGTELSETIEIATMANAVAGSAERTYCRNFAPPGLIYGLLLKAVADADGLLVGGNLRIARYTSEPKKRVNITHRASTLTVRTLTLAEDIGVWKSMQFRVVGVDSDDPAQYNSDANTPAINEGAITGTDGATLVYSGTGSLEESETESAGYIEYY
jgi:hypothetical protein